MGFLFGGGRSAPPPKRDNAEVQVEASRERRRQALARGRSSTILGGLDGEPDAVLKGPQLGSKTLLGQ